MRVVVPFTQRHPDIEAAMPADAEWYDVSDSPYAYHALLERVWADGETFLIVEHDVVYRASTAEAYESCPEPWCLSPYDDMCHWSCMEAWANSIGFTRFDKSLMEAVPDALSIDDPKLRVWTDVCNGLGENLRAAGFTHHWHFPVMRHHTLGRPGRGGFRSEDSGTFPAEAFANG